MVLRSFQSVSCSRTRSRAHSVSQSVNRFGRQFQPTFWRYYAVRLHIIQFYLYVYNCLCICVRVCVFSIVFRYIYGKVHK